LVQFAKSKGAKCEVSLEPDDLLKKQVTIGDMVVILLDILNVQGDNLIEIILRITELRTMFGAGIFIIVWTKHANANPFVRQELMEFDTRNDWERTNMVTFEEKALKHVAEQILTYTGKGKITCPVCGMKKLTEDEFWWHCPLFHENRPFDTAKPPRWKFPCPLCRKVDTFVHYRNNHGPVAKGLISKEVNTGIFALSIVQRKDGRFLLCQEFCNQGYWLPGGQLDPGESLRKAAERECLEEAGVKIRHTEVLEILDKRRGTWRRVIFLGEPIEGDAYPKTIPDFESVGACWVSIKEIQSGRLKFRAHSEIKTLLSYALGELKPQSLSDVENIWTDVKL